jgi:hypothetical protein
MAITALYWFTMGIRELMEMLTHFSGEFQVGVDPARKAYSVPESKISIKEGALDNTDLIPYQREHGIHNDVPFHYIFRIALGVAAISMPMFVRATATKSDSGIPNVKLLLLHRYYEKFITGVHLVRLCVGIYAFIAMFPPQLFWNTPGLYLTMAPDIMVRLGVVYSTFAFIGSVWKNLHVWIYLILGLVYLPFVPFSMFTGLVAMMAGPWYVISVGLIVVILTHIVKKCGNKYAIGICYLILSPPTYCFVAATSMRWVNNWSIGADHYLSVAAPRHNVNTVTYLFGDFKFGEPTVQQLFEWSIGGYAYTYLVAIALIELILFSDIGTGHDKKDYNSVA